MLWMRYEYVIRVTLFLTGFRLYIDNICQPAATGDGIVNCTAGSSSGVALYSS